MFGTKSQINLVFFDTFPKLPYWTKYIWWAIFFRELSSWRCWFSSQWQLWWWPKFIFLSFIGFRSDPLSVFFLTIWRLDFWKLDLFMPGTLFLPLPRASLQSNGAIIYFIIKSQLSKSSSPPSSSRLLVIMATKIINRCDCHLQAFRPLLITTTIIINWSRWWKRCDC